MREKKLAREAANLASRESQCVELERNLQTKKAEADARHDEIQATMAKVRLLKVCPRAPVWLTRHEDDRS